MSLIDRFTGPGGERSLRESLASAKLALNGSAQLIDDIISAGECIEFPAGAELIQQNGEENELYILIAGTCDVSVNHRTVAHRGPGDHVGEMAAIEPTQRRSATVTAAEDVVALKLLEPDFHKIGSQHPTVYRNIARELARRLLQRNSSVGAYRDAVKLFIISSAEALPIARAVQNAFEHDPINVIIWTDGVFKIANYTLQSLEDAVDDSDFAIAIAHADDVTAVQGADWPTPRDNVIFELGLFMGRLGRSRAILMEPREDRVKLPSDLTGVTTIPYAFKTGTDAAASLGPACNRLRDHINALGPNNG